MPRPRTVLEPGQLILSLRSRPLIGRPLALLICVALLGGFLGGLKAPETNASPLAEAPREEVSSLRVYGHHAISNPNRRPEGNRPVTAGSNDAIDECTGLIPEDPPYFDPAGPFDPSSPEAPETDLVTWNPAWISERLTDPDLQAAWPGLTGMDEVSANSNIRASSVNASEKVWLRHWYEPYHLDKDLNADGRLTDSDNDGVPDAPMNPVSTAIDEWYPAIMSEMTYMLMENDPVPFADPDSDELWRSAPRPACGAAGSTSIVFPVGVEIDQTEATTPSVGHGLTSLDANFDGELDMVRVTDEENLPNVLGGIELDFDGDGVLDALGGSSPGLDCNDMVVLHTESMSINPGEKLQFLDHFVKLRAVSNNSVVIEVWNNYSKQPRLIQSRTLGIGSALMAGDTGPVLNIVAGGDNLGDTPPGAWFAYLVDADTDTDSAILILGRALGAPCASMESAPLVQNTSECGPWFLKRMYVDGHEYNTTAIGSCDNGDLPIHHAPLPPAEDRCRYRAAFRAAPKLCDHRSARSSLATLAAALQPRTYHL